MCSLEYFHIKCPILVRVHAVIVICRARLRVNGVQILRRTKVRVNDVKRVLMLRGKACWTRVRLTDVSVLLM